MDERNMDKPTNMGEQTPPSLPDQKFRWIHGYQSIFQTVTHAHEGYYGLELTADLHL